MDAPARKSAGRALQTKEKYSPALRAFALGRDVRWIEREHELSRERVEAALRAALDIERRARLAAESYIGRLDASKLAEFCGECAELEAEIWEDLERPLLRERKPMGRATHCMIPVAMGLLSILRTLGPGVIGRAA